MNALSAFLDIISSGEYPRFHARKIVNRRATIVIRKFGQAFSSYCPFQVHAAASETGHR
jgi:hypothetical protein